MTKRKHYATAHERELQGLPPFNHPKSLLQTLTSVEYKSFHNPVCINLDNVLMHLDKVLSSHEVFSIAYNVWLMLDTLPSAERRRCVKQLVKDGCTQSANQQDVVTMFNSKDIEMFFLKINSTYRKSVKLGLPTELEKAISVLSDALSVDEEYRRGWVANIAMSMLDVYTTKVKGYTPTVDGGKSVDIHAIVNEGAERFINLLIAPRHKSPT